MSKARNEQRELSLEMLEQINGAGFGGVLGSATRLNAKLSPSGGSGGRQTIDPAPGLGSDYSGDSAGGGGSGGYMGDGNYLRPF